MDLDRSCPLMTLQNVINFWWLNFKWSTSKNSLKHKITYFVGNKDERILNNLKIKMHINVGVGGKECPYCIYNLLSYSLLILKWNIMVKFVQSQGLLMHPQIILYGGFNFTGTSYCYCSSNWDVQQIRYKVVF